MGEKLIPSAHTWCGDLVWGSHVPHPLQEELPGAGVDAAVLQAWFRGAVSSLPALPSLPPAAGKTCPGGDPRLPAAGLSVHLS